METSIHNDKSIHEKLLHCSPHVLTSSDSDNTTSDQEYAAESNAGLFHAVDTILPKPSVAPVFPDGGVVANNQSVT